VTKRPITETDLDPRGEIHIPIGVPNTLDTLKTFVEAEGCFSPGVGSYGIYFWIYDRETETLTAPTMSHVRSEHGLHETGYLIPWVQWAAGSVNMTMHVFQVSRPSPDGDCLVVGARLVLTNSWGAECPISLYAALRPLGPAGGDVTQLCVSAVGDALLADGHVALAAKDQPTLAGVLSSDTIGTLALAGAMPTDRTVHSDAGDCSGALRFDCDLASGAMRGYEFLYPVLPGRYAARHRWEDLGQNALADMAELNAPDNGILQPEPDLSYYRSLQIDDLHCEAVDYWADLMGDLEICLPDPRWGQGMRAMLGHAGLCMNEGAADVAVVNYNVFNRDGMYVANMMQKSGLFALAEQAVGYFLSHPFNGRAHPEADNPGQILWSLAQQWLFARDSEWLTRVYPSVRQIAEMIRYYRSTPGPHWVDMTSLQFGDALPETQRSELKPGRCDGHHPEYTEAFDIAGLNSAAVLAQASRDTDHATMWAQLSAELQRAYDAQFGDILGKGYGSYAVLWPCRLYPLTTGKAHEQFRHTGALKSRNWRYFPLATAHQGLLAGNRDAGFGTVDLHLNESQMQGWYAFDEGGGSGSGGWHRVRTTWTRDIHAPGQNRSVAMPHGWAIAELWLLMRDCLLFENDADQLVLFPGVSPAWFRHPSGMRLRGLQTAYGACDLTWQPDGNGATLQIGGVVNPPNGFVLRLPPDANAVATFGQTQIEADADGNCVLPGGIENAFIQFRG